MATKKPAAKKGAASAVASKGSGSQINAAELRGIDEASKFIAQAVKRAVAAQPTTTRIRNPIIVGIYYNPKTKQIEIINQLNQF
ncbi:MAG: hypothetical protein H0T60_14355 [Acidobacteria bacterium]|nr:hypothetical protein [Acidobacteriota bacterium]